MLGKLGETLKNSIKKITGATFVDERLINEIVKDLQRGLLQSDVNVKLVFAIGQKIKEKAIKEKPPKEISYKEFLIKTIYDVLVSFIGGEFEPIKIDKKPYKIMLVGLFGNGKTTTAGKLAKYYKKRGKKVLLISTDTWRPAAGEQLKQLAEQIGVDYCIKKEEKKPEKIYSYCEKEKKMSNYDLIIIDTAGRDALNNELIEELNIINKKVEPDQTFLVMSADIGQAAENQAKKFHETCKITGVIITKLDGTAKGGGALIACAITKAPVRFIGTGEKIDELEEFQPKRFIGRLLGMGDLETLLEKANEVIDKEKAEQLSKRFLKGEYTLVDLYEQMQAMRKMGPLNKIISMIPGLGTANIPKELLETQEEKLKIWKYIMDSMTKKELENPEIINPSRIERIAKGSGQSNNEVRSLIKQYKQSKKMVKLMKGIKGNDEKDIQKLLAKIQKKGLKKFKF